MADIQTSVILFDGGRTLPVMTWYEAWKARFVRNKETVDEQRKQAEDSGPFLKARVRLLFVIQLDAIGENEEANAFLREQKAGNTMLEGACAALVVLSDSELYTKTYAKKFIFLTNQMGCEWIGHPVFEVIEGYKNFNVWARTLQLSPEAAAKHRFEETVERLETYKPLQKDAYKFLVLHAGHKTLSNTLALWSHVEEKLVSAPISIQTLHVEEGRITDCYGCSFETCLYYSMEKSCFYGGFVVEELYPQIEAADFVVWICPNYNDAISAKLMAVVNRLTALYRQIRFYDKYVLAVVVSGNSGCDTVAEQLIGALAVNKGFRLPPRFALMALASAPGEIENWPSLEAETDKYVRSIKLLMDSEKEGKGTL